MPPVVLQGALDDEGSVGDSIPATFRESPVAWSLSGEIRKGRDGMLHAEVLGAVGIDVRMTVPNVHLCTRLADGAAADIRTLATRGTDAPVEQELEAVGRRVHIWLVPLRS